MRRTIILAVLVVILGAMASAKQRQLPSLPQPKITQPQPPSQSAQQQSAPDQRGTENSPVVVKVLAAPKSEEETAEDKAERKDVSSANWWMVRLTAAIGFIGIV